MPQRAGGGGADDYDQDGRVNTRISPSGGGPTKSHKASVQCDEGNAMI